MSVATHYIEDKVARLDLCVTSGTQMPTICRQSCLLGTVRCAPERHEISTYPLASNVSREHPARTE
jgi:hypothetical protein